MSGFEVAGLVLGAVPLLVAALEGYQKLGKKRDAFARRSIHIGKMIRSLRTQHSLIQGDVEIVLRNAEVDQEVLENLAYSTLNSILSRDEVEIEVQAFLGAHYVSYRQVLEDCERVLLELARCISTFKEGSWVAQGSLAALLSEKQHLRSTPEEIWKRVQFSMKKDEIDSAIEELDRATFRLQRLSQQSAQLKQVSSVSASSKTKAMVSLLRKVQHKATMLHQAFSQYWSTRCQHPHQARLHLETRLDESGCHQPSSGMMKSKSNSKNITFRVTLEGEGHHSHSFLYTCNIHAVEEEPRTASGKVTFGPVPPSSTMKSTTSVDNICRLVHSFSAGPDILQLFLDDNANLLYCGNASMHTGALAPGWPWQPSMISLQDVLHAKTVRFSRKLRVNMAALVASSILQLHATPWTASLRKDAIFFAQDSTGKIELQYPFIACRFDCQGQLARTQVARGEADLLELGIIIMELWEKEPLEEYARRTGLVVDNTYDTRQSLARTWLADLEDEFIPSFYEVAFRCINCRFDTIAIDLSDAKLNRSIFELVVKPLWDNCGR